MVNHQFQDLTTTLGALLEDLLPTRHPMHESAAALRCTAWLPIHSPVADTCPIGMTGMASHFCLLR